MCISSHSVDLPDVIPYLTDCASSFVAGSECVIVPSDGANTSLDTPVTGIGLKLLQKMGWKEGRGLGRDESGTKDPISLCVKSLSYLRSPIDPTSDETELTCIPGH